MNTFPSNREWFAYSDQCHILDAEWMNLRKVRTSSEKEILLLFWSVISQVQTNFFQKITLSPPSCQKSLIVASCDCNPSLCKTTLQA